MTVHSLEDARKKPVSRIATSLPIVSSNKLCLECKHCIDPTGRGYPWLECIHPENTSAVHGGSQQVITWFRRNVCKGQYWEQRSEKPRKWWQIWRLH